jgi:hypothetical protein
MKNFKSLNNFLNDDVFNENILPRAYKKVKCAECGEDVCDNINYKIGHLYNKHNCKPSIDDYKAKRMLKQYFPKPMKENVDEDEILKNQIIKVLNNYAVNVYSGDYSEEMLGIWEEDFDLLADDIVNLLK